MRSIRQLRWEFGSVLPPEIKYNMSEQEVRRIHESMQAVVGSQNMAIWPL